MADISDVEQALVDAIAGLLYPSGTSSPSAIGADASIYRGWPVPNALDDDLRVGRLNISVYPRPGTVQRVAGHPKEWLTLGSPAASLAAQLSPTAPTITLSGTGGTNHLVTVIVDSLAAYSLRCTAAQSAASVAAAMAALIPGASAAGSVVTVSGARRLTARIGVDTPAIRELRRQRRSVQVTFWCPTPQLRDQVGTLVDGGLAGMSYLSLPDGTSARLLFTGDGSDDAPAKQQLFRRDLIFSVEYSTVETATFPVVTSVTETIGGGLAPSDTPIGAVVAPVSVTLAT